MFSIKEIKDKKISIIGAARSGVSAAKLLSSFGANVFVSDKGNKKKLGLFLNELDDNKINYELETHSDRILDADFAVLSPGVPSNSDIIQKLISKGIKVYSELEVASWFCQSRIIAITGSNGKTTTTSMIYAIFKGTGIPVFIAGNIGDAFSNYIGESSRDGVAVLEVSSFQLDHIESFHPEVSIIINITPDHMDRYGTFENYIASKGRIFMNQTNDDFLVYNFDDEVTTNLVKKAKCRLLPFSIKQKPENGGYIDNGRVIINFNGSKMDIMGVDQIGTPGKHNLYNALASALAAVSIGVKSEIICKSLSSFQGVEHRLEFVLSIDGIDFYNDSKATNVDSVWYALDSFDRTITLIAGGRDKGNDYSPLIPLIQRKVKTMILIGEAAKKMEECFSPYTKILKAGSMEEAVHFSYKNSRCGDVVLLSPACASFDMFENYEHRGKVFKNEVNNFYNKILKTL